MKNKNFNYGITSGLAFATLFSLSGCQKNIPDELPNILWLTSEDNSPLLGCYGDSFATTPNLDKMASEGFLYTHAYANAPVSAPARNTIITGVYACSNGNQHMRSRYPLSEEVVPFTALLREAGYYCTNNAKTDYNTSSIRIKDIWDESSNDAHYKNRPANKPFFAVFNATMTHESCIHDSIPNEKLRHDPEKVSLPPYHPPTPAMKHDWAQFYDKMEELDSWVGDKLKELEEAGLAENTIVFYYGDHGGIIGRSKRYVYETGTRVPFIVKIPKKYKHLFPEKRSGSSVNRLISFVDLAPTLMSITGISIPDFMQGSAFLGQQKTEDPEYAFMFRGRMDERFDMSRAVRDQKYRYIRNYMPFRIYGQQLEFLWRAPSMRSWERAYLNNECDETQSAFWNKKPIEELYDTENDPWEVNNLANDPAYAEILNRMRNANKNWTIRIKDTGFIPESQFPACYGEKSMYDYMRSGKVNLETIINAAEVATMGSKDNLQTLTSYLSNDEPAIRFWGATGLLILGEDAAEAENYLISALNDPAIGVVTVAAEALYNLGKKEQAGEALIRALSDENEMARCHALNAIDIANINNPKTTAAVVEMIKSLPELNRKFYDLRSARQLLEKWEQKPEKYGISFGW